MHKLRGSSGLIGAMTVHRLAGAAERSLEQNEPAEFVEVILAQLATALTNLREEAEPQLNAHPAPAGIQNDAAPLAAADLSELLDLLDGQNLAAMDYFETLSSSLRGMLDATRFSLLQQAVDQLDFQQAAALLRSANLQADSSRLRTLAQ